MRKGNAPKCKVAIVCHIWSHYRTEVGEELFSSDSIDYHIYSSGTDLNGIKHAAIMHLQNFHVAPHRYFGKFLWQGAAVRLAASREYDALILLGDPNFISTWVGALIARAFNVPCLFWTHGWLRREKPIRRFVRKVFYALSTKLLVYSERGKRIGALEGFPEEKMVVVYNSIANKRAAEVVAAIQSGSLKTIHPRNLFPPKGRPVIICTGRLTKAVGLDVLFDAAKILEKSDNPINVLLVGDGPELERLKDRAQEDGISVHFFGACYDEEVVGQLIYHSDLTVAPGKIGLTAMHTLMYGTPAITHGDLDRQMPEVEALVQGITGDFFAYGDPASLADKISIWLSRTTDRESVRQAAFREIEAKWTATNQAQIIERTVLSLK